MRPDVVFTRKRVCVFIDGCFWHGCASHGRLPAANRDYWTAKIAGNRQRDSEITSALEAAGWTVVRGWEHEEPAALVERVFEALHMPASGIATTTPRR